MPIVAVDRSERYPDYELNVVHKDKPGKIKHVYPSGGWRLVDYIEMTEVELNDWKRVQDELEKWEEKIQARIKALPDEVEVAQHE